MLARASLSQHCSASKHVNWKVDSRNGVDTVNIPTYPAIVRVLSSPEHLEPPRAVQFNLRFGYPRFHSMLNHVLTYSRLTLPDRPFSLPSSFVVVFVPDLPNPRLILDALG